LALNHKSYFVFAILWTCFVSTLSLITISPEIGKSFVFDLNDKYVHFAFYLVFVIVWFLFLIKTKFTKNAKNIALITAILYGIIIETGILIIKLAYKNSKTTP